MSFWYQIQLWHQKFKKRVDSHYLLLFIKWITNCSNGKWLFWYSPWLIVPVTCLSFLLISFIRSILGSKSQRDSAVHCLIESSIFSLLLFLPPSSLQGSYLLRLKSRHVFSLTLKSRRLLSCCRFFVCTTVIDDKVRNVCLQRFLWKVIG